MVEETSNAPVGYVSVSANERTRVAGLVGVLVRVLIVNAESREHVYRALHARRDRTIVAIEEAGSDTFRLAKVESGASASQKTFGTGWAAWLFRFVKVNRIWQIPMSDELNFGRHSSCRLRADLQANNES